MSRSAWMEESVSYKAVRLLAGYVAASGTIRLARRGILRFTESAGAAVSHSDSRRFFRQAVLPLCMTAGAALDRIVSLYKSSSFARVMNRKI